MAPDVLFQFVMCDESFATRWTFVWSNVHVHHHMSLEVGLLDEALATHVTLVRLLSSMYPYMFFKVFFLSERFIADFTGECSLLASA